MSERNTVDLVRDMAQEAQNKVTNTVEAAKGVGQQTRAAAESIGEMAQDAARQVADRATAAASTLSAQGGCARSYVSRTVEENPLTAVLVAGAVGYAVACLLHRPS
jgi:ElaB/YqjD/DUF883 family membrane-anchored ribosome-binding protein